MTTKAKVSRPRKPKTALAAIRQLRKIFLECEEKSKLWDVLTALRGCDLDTNDSLKWATTAIIRNAVFGNKPDGFSRAFFTAYDNDSLMAERIAASDRAGCTYHFKQHAEWAFAVLGLKWSDANGEIKPV